MLLVALAHLGKLAQCSPDGASTFPCVHFESAGLSAGDLVEAVQPFTSAGYAFSQADIEIWAQRVGLGRVAAAVGLTLEELESGLLLLSLGGFFSIGLLGPVIWRALMAYQSRGVTVTLLALVGLSRVFLKLATVLTDVSRVLLDEREKVVADVGNGAAAARKWKAD